MGCEGVLLNEVAGNICRALSKGGVDGVAAPGREPSHIGADLRRRQGLTLVHFSAQLMHFLRDTLGGLCISVAKSS
jgi:hypothetical protein